MLATGHKLLAAICSLLLVPSSFSLSNNCSLCFSLCLTLLWKDSRQVWQRYEADGKDDSRNFSERKWKPEDVTKKTNPAHKQSCMDFVFLLLYCWCVTITFVHTHMPTVHMPSIISLFDALALGLIGMLESVTAYIIKMMEMSLSPSVLWLTWVLVAKIEFQACISFIWQCTGTAIRTVYVQPQITHTGLCM